MVDRILESLLAVRETLSAPERWTQKAFARDRTAEMVSVNNDTAECWCLVGAINRLASKRHRGILEKRISDKLDPNPTVLVNPRIIVRWNDDPTREFQDVANLLDGMIAERRAR